MPALTELLDKPIRVPTGEAVALLQDVVVRVPQPDQSPAVTAAAASAGTALAVASPAEVYPPVIGLVARLKTLRGARQVFIPWDKVSQMDTSGVALNSPAMNLRRFEQRDGELVLKKGLFDRQVMDVEGRRVVRINDLDLAYADGVYRLVAVDVGPGALLRRAVGPRLGERVASFVRRETGAKPPLIDWAQVAPVQGGPDGSDGALRLRVPRERLALMEPADLARVVEQLTPKEGAALLDELDEAIAADTLEELEDEQQGQLLRVMDPERAADLLEEMEPDEATDALQNVTAEEAADLLKRMDREDAEDVQELLGYPEDSAGGIMTTEYVAVAEWANVTEVRAAMRAQAQRAARDQDDPLPDALPEIYVVVEDEPPKRAPAVKRNGARTRPTAGKPTPTATEQRHLSLWTEGRLVGVVSLRDLLLAEPEAPIREVMHPVECVAHPLDNERDVARLIADEDLVALPIVDDAGKMLGIVTVDDAIDVILPTAWKKRIPRRFH